MEVLTGIITDAEVVSSTEVILDSQLPDTDVNVTKSITAEVSPQNYVLSTGGMYGAGFTGAAPTWLLDAVQQELTTGTGSVMTVLQNMQTLLDSLQLGVNQNISQIESTILSQSALATSVQSQIDGNEAAILNVAATRVTPTEAQTIATQVQQSTFGLDATAFIGSVASTYVDAGSAIAQEVGLITAELNGISASITTIDSVLVSQGTTISQLQTDTGVNIADLQAQLDNTVDMWFYSETPTLLNKPTMDWISIVDKKTHNGDLYYNKVTGVAYQYSYDGTTEAWNVVTDQIKIDALYQASLRNDTLDGKKSIYYTATSPAPMAADGITPIAIETGDLWVNSTDGITKIRSAGGLWVDVTNTATQNALIDLSVLEETNDGVVYTFYQATEPGTAMTYGDWWVDTDTNPLKVYRYEDINGKDTIDHITYPLAWREKNPANNIIAANAINSDYAKKKIDSVVAGTTQIDLAQHNNSTGWTTDASLTNWISTVYDPFVAGIDSIIETFFGDVQPTLANAPANAWTDIATKDLHLGDIYYDTLSGIGYRFVVLGGVYSWNAISDSGVAAALEAAANAQDTADGKRRTFISGWDSVNLVWTPVLPVPPYDRGDLFTPLVDTVSGLITFYKNEVYVCNVAKITGTVFSNTDFVAGTNAKVTNDAIAALDSELGLLKGLVDNKVETFMQVAPPHPTITMAITDPLVQEYDTYIKDLWFSTSMGNKTYIYKRTATGDVIVNYGFITEAANLPTKDNGLVLDALTSSRDLALGGVLQMPTGTNDYVYTWEETLVPSAVFDAIDGKKVIFTTAPSKYFVRDILIPAVTFVSGGVTFQANEIYISSTDATVFDASHWSKATKYTDDTTASIAIANAADAQADATLANTLLADIASDDKFTPAEKQKVKLEWDTIVTEVSKILSNATSVGILTTDAVYLAYSNIASPYGKYQLLSTYITPLLTDLTITSDIVGTTFRSTFKAYYDAKVDLLNAIALKAKTLADTAQTTANAKSQILYTSTAPTLLTYPLLDAGDQWVNTTTSELKVWNGTAWTTTTNDTANKAYVIATATPHLYNSPAATTPVAVAPIVLATGDLWVVTDRWYTDATTSSSGSTRTIYGYLVKKYNGSTWGDITNTEAKSSVLKWEAKSSKYITAPDGSITGFEMSDGSGQNSAFTITADTFKVVASGQSVASKNPLTVDTATGEISFVGVVDFTSTNAVGTTTIDGGKITTGSITTEHISTTGLNAGVIKAGVIYNTGGNATTYTMKIDLDLGEIHIK